VNWQTTYPDLATMMQAGFETLLTWRENLPAPQTDVERTIHRRLRVRLDEVAHVELRRQAPDIANKLDSLREKIRQLTEPPRP
jgi:hypothetical protein